MPQNFSIEKLECNGEITSNFNKTNEAENPVQMFICWPFLQSSSFILKILIILHKYYVLNVKIIIKLW